MARSNGLDLQDCLVLFSGGKDSFLTACNAIKQGYRAILLSCSNGCIVGEKNFSHGAKRLIRKYGEDRVQFAGIAFTVGGISKFNESWSYKSFSALAENYPHLSNYQVICLTCQTAMWASALAYARAKEITQVVCGYRRSDLFCTGMEEYLARIRLVAKQFGIAVDVPVWDLVDEWERDRLMSDYGFEPRVLEASCVLGCPCKEHMSSEYQNELMQYFDFVLKRTLVERIKELTPIYRVIRLGDEYSVNVGNYNLPEE